jgi:hypothetical protein
MNEIDFALALPSIVLDNRVDYDTNTESVTESSFSLVFWQGSAGDSESMTLIEIESNDIEDSEYSHSTNILEIRLKTDFGEVADNDQFDGYNVLKFEFAADDHMPTWVTGSTSGPALSGLLSDDIILPDFVGTAAPAQHTAALIQVSCCINFNRRETIKKGTKQQQRPAQQEESQHRPLFSAEAVAEFGLTNEGGAVPEQLALKHRSGKHTSHSAKHKHQPSTATATDKKKDNKSGGSSCKPGKGSRKTSSSKWEEARKRQKESTEPDVKESTQPDIMAQKQALEDEVMARKDRKSKLKKEQAAAAVAAEAEAAAEAVATEAAAAAAAATALAVAPKATKTPINHTMQDTGSRVKRGGVNKDSSIRISKKAVPNNKAHSRRPARPSSPDSPSSDSLFLGGPRISTAVLLDMNANPRDQDLVDESGAQAQEDPKRLRMETKGPGKSKVAKKAVLPKPDTKGKGKTKSLAQKATEPRQSSRLSNALVTGRMRQQQDEDQMTDELGQSQHQLKTSPMLELAIVDHQNYIGDVPVTVLEPASEVHMNLSQRIDACSDKTPSATDHEDDHVAVDYSDMAHEEDDHGSDDMFDAKRQQKKVKLSKKDPHQVMKDLEANLINNDNDDMAPNNVLRKVGGGLDDSLFMIGKAVGDTHTQNIYQMPSHSQGQFGLFHDVGSTNDVSGQYQILTTAISNITGSNDKQTDIERCRKNNSAHAKMTSALQFSSNPELERQEQAVSKTTSDNAKLKAKISLIELSLKTKLSKGNSDLLKTHEKFEGLADKANRISEGLSLTRNDLAADLGEGNLKVTARAGEVMSAQLNKIQSNTSKGSKLAQHRTVCCVVLHSHSHSGTAFLTFTEKQLLDSLQHFMSEM